MSFEKIVENGRVAVIYSPGFGAGWSTWNGDKAILCMHADLVRLLQSGGTANQAETLGKQLTGEEYICVLGWEDCEIMWIPQGQQFEINEYDGSESVHVIGDGSYLTA